MKIWCNVPFKHTAGNSRFLNNTIRCALTLFTSNDEKRLLDKTLINFNLPRSWLPRILREIVISPAINSSRPSQCFMLSNAKENSLAAGFLVQWIQKTSPQSADYCKNLAEDFSMSKKHRGILASNNYNEPDFNACTQMANASAGFNDSDKGYGIFAAHMLDNIIFARRNKHKWTNSWWQRESTSKFGNKFNTLLSTCARTLCFMSAFKETHRIGGSILEKGYAL